MRLAHHAIALFLVLSSAVAARASTYIWSGAGADNKWSTPANWQGNTAPNVADASPDTLVFLDGAAQNSTHNDLPAGSQIAVLQFHGGWHLTGNQIRVTDRIEHRRRTRDVRERRRPTVGRRYERHGHTAAVAAFIHQSIVSPSILIASLTGVHL